MLIRRLDYNAALAALPELTTLLQDAVEHGASVGFLPPLGYPEAGAYWQGVASAVAEGVRVLLVATLDEKIAGTVQLDLVMRPNGRHRAEVAKLMVHSAYRRRGIGAALMQAIEDEARANHRTTLVLDTRAGDPSEHLYTNLGYHTAGTIPAYAQSANGALHTTVFMYKLLPPGRNIDTG